MRSISLIAAWCALCVGAGACADAKPARPAKACAKEYEQCTLPTGVLGVCTPVDCAQGQPAPCLVCRSQH